MSMLRVKSGAKQTRLCSSNNTIFIHLLKKSSSIQINMAKCAFTRSQIKQSIKPELNHYIWLHLQKNLHYLKQSSWKVLKFIFWSNYGCKVLNFVCISVFHIHVILYFKLHLTWCLFTRTQLVTRQQNLWLYICRFAIDIPAEQHIVDNKMCI